MTKIRKESVSCPKCGKSFDITLTESVNTSLNPENTDKVLSGEIFRHTCPNCETSVFVDSPLLYHQMNDGIMIQYAPGYDNMAEIVEAFDNVRKNLTSEIPSDLSYTYRIVSTLNELKEKICILDRGMDDRAVELMKVVIYGKFLETQPELQIEEFLLEARKDEELRFVFRVSDGRWGYTDYDPRLYGALKEQFIPETEDINENYIVNFAWAVDRLSD